MKEIDFLGNDLRSYSEELISCRNLCKF